MDSKTHVKLEELLKNTGDMALKRRARSIILHIDPQPGDRILDVGCGDGYYLHLLSHLGIKNLTLTGTDYDKNGLISAKRNLNNPKIKLVWSDLMKKSPFRSNSFDKIVMSEVAEHLPDDVKGLTEVCRILKPGGTICLSVPNANYPFLWDPLNRILESFWGTHVKSGFWAGLWNMHIRLYKPQQIKKVMQKAGFKLRVVKSLTWWCLPFNHYIINATAIAIHSGKMNPDLKAAVNKYETNVRRPFILNLAFWFANTIDSLNNYFPNSSSGVGVFVVATKLRIK